MLIQITDYTWALVPYTMCISIELSIIIITASIPLLRPLFRRQKPPRCTLGGDAWPEGRNISMSAIRLPQMQNSWSPDMKGTISRTSLAWTLSMPQTPSGGITVTTDIDISYHSHSAPAIHASLIGLVSHSDDFRYPDSSTDGQLVHRRCCW